MKISKQASQHGKGQSGLTLIELIVVIVIIGILSGFISNIISYEADAYNTVVNQTEGLQLSRNALQLMLRDFRHIMAPDSIFHAALDSVKFDLVDDVFVKYKLVNNDILRNGDLLLPVVDDLQFTYFDSVGTQLSVPVATPSDINTINVSLTTSINGRAFNLSSRVRPRNF